jgi:CRISPR-associated protein Csm5
MNRPKVYQLTITTLTPLHIGSGRELRRGYDYVTHKGKTWIINPQVFAERMFERDKKDALAFARPISEYLTPNDYREDDELFRYVLSGEPTSKEQGSEVRELIKDAWDRPYIPGSSLKGALRTALLYTLFSQKDLKFSMSGVGDTAKTAAQNYEHRLMVVAGKGGNEFPYYDLGRLFHVGDSTPDNDRRMELANVRVFKGDKGQSPIELEALKRDVTLIAHLTIDIGLINNANHQYGEILKWDDDQKSTVDDFVERIQFWTKKRFKREKAKHARSGLWKNSFDQLENMANSLAPDEFMLQLGWGGGWTSKTLGHNLSSQEGEFARLVNTKKYNMLRKGKFEVGDPYPKTRRVVVNHQSGNPLYELGWIKVKVEEVR